jgi:glycosyltransferase involved in cell wall biosynthesis
LAERQGRRMALRSSFARQIAADLGRMLLRYTTARQAVRSLGLNLDLVYERFASMQALGRTFQRRGIPWVLETSGPFYYEAKVERSSMVLTGLARRLELKAYRDCDVLICVSEPLREILERAADLDPSKILVVPNGVDTERFDPDRHPVRRMATETTVGFVGAVNEYQGLDLLLYAVADLHKIGRSMSAVIVGEGPALASLVALADSLGISRFVHFVGHVSWDAVPMYIRGFDLGYSGQRVMKIGHMYHSPLKLYEYLAMGVPIVAADFDDARRLLADGGAGVLFPSGGRNELGDALRKASDRLAVEPSWGAAGRLRIVAGHSWEARVRAMIEAIGGILERRRVNGGATSP